MMDPADLTTLDPNIREVVRLGPRLLRVLVLKGDRLLRAVAVATLAQELASDDAATLDGLRTLTANGYAERAHPDHAEGPDKYWRATAAGLRALTPRAARAA